MSWAYEKRSSNSFKLQQFWELTTTSGVSDAERKWEDYLVGTKHPTWRVDCAAGRQATTSMVAEKKLVTYQPMSYGGEYYVSDSHTQANYRKAFDRGAPLVSANFGSDANLLDVSAAQREAAGKYYAAAVRERRSLQSGVLIGELGESFRMIKKGATDMMSLLTRWNSDLRRSKRYTRTRKHRLKEASDRWLEYSFGWAPLASSISGVLGYWTTPRRELKRIQGRGTTESRSKTPGNPIGVGPIYYAVSTETISKASFKYYGAIQAEAGGLSGVSERFGVLPTDFVPTLYELLPWSFLADYFSNLGGIVNALCFPRGLIAWEAQTVKKETSKVYATRYDRPSDNLVIRRNTQSTDQSPGRLELHHSVVSRLPIDFVPIPSFSLRVPGYTSQWLNIGALVAASKFKYWP